MQHKLIIFMGSAPGAGKSTLSEFLFDQFTLHGIPTHWIYEEDILYLDTFRPVVQALLHGQGDAIEALLTTTRQFVQDAVYENQVIITDSIFPAYTWLFAAGYPRASIADFSTQLAQLLAPLEPLTIYLNSDVATSLTRAVAQRGTSWLDGLISTMQTYRYCQTHPVNALEDVIVFFQMVAQLSDDLLAEWPHATLILDTVTTGLERTKVVLLQHLNLSRQAAAPMPTVAELYNYVGLYVPHDGLASTAPLEIRLVDGELVVNTYWPNGCRLIPEGPAQFRLQSTNRRVRFIAQPLAESHRLAYTFGGNTYYYDKTVEP